MTHISGKTAMFARSRTARSTNERIFREFPTMSPTVGLICASAIRIENDCIAEKACSRYRGIFGGASGWAILALAMCELAFRLRCAAGLVRAAALLETCR